MSKQDERTMALGDIVPEYDSRFFIVKNLFWDRIRYALALAHLRDDSQVLDVGCGIGYLASEIRNKNATCPITCIDINVHVNELSIPGCTFRVDDITTLDLPDCSFDVIFALDSLEHIQPVEQAVHNIGRLLKPGGELIVSGPTESAFYKFCRFLIKGTFSMEEGPGTGVHYHTIEHIDNVIRQNRFTCEQRRNLPNIPLCVLVKVFRYVRTDVLPGEVS